MAILLGTYQGEGYLHGQLASIAAQTHSNWEVWASDDGSTDGTHGVLEAWERGCGRDRVTIVSGPAAGFATNFLHLVCMPAIDADYYAYSDQDDVWEPHKLERAVAWLRSVPEGIPALYCSRTCLIDAPGNAIGHSPLFAKPPSFANALMQNIAGGNTMVFNDAARALLREAGADVDVVTHDWWTYLVVTGCGGRVFYDVWPSVRYRQHEGNLVGMNSTWPARLVRLRMQWRGVLRDWIDRNIEALHRLRPRLTAENRDALDRFVAARRSSLLRRLVGLHRCGVHRQTLLGNLGLIVAAVFRKV